ncbi:MAG: hypothetical protein KC618_00175, partial [Candidatus Omnitrophica bacterium]|nr:hypothetical protein [Candidatus Omnitrophota bacterium]
LGLVETELLFAIVDAIGQKDCAAALKALQDIVEKGKDAKQLSKDLIEHFRHMMVIKVGGKSMGKLVDYPIAIKEMILKQCELFSLAAILNAIDTLIQAQETARITESVRMPLEVAFAKLTYRGEGIRRVAEPEQKTEAKSSGGGVRFSSSILQNEKGQVDISGFQEKSDDLPAPLEETEISDGVEEEPVDIGYDEEPGNGVNVDLEKICRSWDTLTHAVSKERMSLATYLQEGFPVEYKSPLLVVGFPKACTFHKEAVEDNQNVQLVERIFTDALRTPVRIEYRIVNHDNNPTTSPAKEEEPFVKSVLNTFKGKVINQWHNE